MPEAKSFNELDEKAIELILNFKPYPNLDKEASKEILKLREQILKLIPRLKKDEREIIELRYIQNLQNEKISQILGKPREEVNLLLLKAIEGIKKDIKNFDLTNYNYKNSDIQQPFRKETKTQPKARKRNSFVGRIFRFAFLLIVISSIYFLIQNFFFKQLPPLNKVIYLSKNFISEQSAKSISFLNEKRSIKKVSTSQTFKSNISSKIQLSGSSSFLPLFAKVTNKFIIEYPKYKIDYSQSNSTKGILDLIEGNADIANSTRPLTHQDIEKAESKGLLLQEHRIALDALIVVANKKNPVNELSLDNLEGVFTGEIRNWQSFGNFPKLISPIVKEKGSGTNSFIVNRILQGNDIPGFIPGKHTNEEIIEFTSKNYFNILIYK